MVMVVYVYVVGCPEGSQMAKTDETQEAPGWVWFLGEAPDFQREKPVVFSPATRFKAVEAGQRWGCTEGREITAAEAALGQGCPRPGDPRRSPPPGGCESSLLWAGAEGDSVPGLGRFGFPVTCAVRFNRGLTSSR